MELNLENSMNINIGAYTFKINYFYDQF